MWPQPSTCQRSHASRRGSSWRRGTKSTQAIINHASSPAYHPRMAVEPFICVIRQDAFETTQYNAWLWFYWITLVSLRLTIPRYARMLILHACIKYFSTQWLKKCIVSRWCPLFFIVFCVYSWSQYEIRGRLGSVEFPLCRHCYLLHAVDAFTGKCHPLLQTLATWRF